MTLAQTDGNFMLPQQDVARNCGSELTHSNNSVTMRSSKSVVPVTQSTPSTDVRNVNACNSTLKTSGEALSANRPHFQYEMSGPRADSTADQLCTDVGSFAERLNQLKSFYGKPGHHLQPDVPAPISEIGALAIFHESLNVDNDESAANDQILLPPPPEFDDSVTVPAPSSFTMSACHSDAVGANSGVGDWSVDEVCNWLDTVDLCKHCASFRVENVNGARLRTLERSELIELGLTDVHDRMQFERALRKVLNNN